MELKVCRGSMEGSFMQRPSFQALLVAVQNSARLDEVPLEWVEDELYAIGISRWENKYAGLIGTGKYSNPNMSAVAYCIGITDIKPKAYPDGVEVERGRPDAADVDIDIEVKRRWEIKEYVREKYGHVANIMTFNYFRGKSAIKAAASVFRIPQGEVNRATKGLTEDPEFPVLDIYDTSDSTKEFRQKYPEVGKLARALEGRIKGTGIHAGGIVLSKLPIEEYVPMETRVDPQDEARDRVPVIAVDMNEAAAIGLIKYDFLGLNNLTVILEAIDYVRERAGKKIDPYADLADLSDSKVYDMLSAGHTKGVFQCMLPSQPIHTKFGVKAAGDIVVGDEVLTHTGAFKRVLLPMSRHSENEMFRVSLAKQNSEPVLLTGEHPILVSTSDGEASWIKVEDIRAGRKRQHDKATDNWQSYVVMPKTQGQSNPVFCGYEVDEQWARFLGLYMAEGCFDEDGRMTFTFNVNETEYHEFVSDFMINRLGMNVRYRVRDGAKWIAGNKKAIAEEWRGAFGTKANKKIVPDFMYSATRESIRAFLIGYAQGDGRILESGSVGVQTSSKSMAWGLRALVTNIGQFTEVKHHTRTMDHGATCDVYSLNYHIGDKSVSRVLETDDYVLVPIRSVEPVEYSGPVVNFEVEDDNSYVSTFAMHNCEGGPYTNTILEMGGVHNFEDLVSSNALVRPGAADSSVGANYIKGKNQGDYEFIHADAKYFTEETYGQCLFQETPVLTSRGAKAIKNIAIGDVVYGQAGQGAVTKKMYTGEKQVYLVTLSNGRSIKASAEHRFLTDAGYVRTDELNGRLVAVPDSSMNTGNLDDHEAAWALGILIAEGSLTGSPYIANNDDGILSHWSEVVSSRFNCDTVEYFNTRCGYSRAVSRKTNAKRPYKNAIAQWLRELGIFEKTNGKKFIPNWVWTLDDNSKCSFIGGWISGDGSVSRNTVKIRTAYEHMANGLHDLLTSLGIHASVRRDADGYTVFLLDNNKYNLMVKKHVYGVKGHVRVAAVSRRGLAPNVIKLDKAATGKTTRSYGAQRSLAVATAPESVSRRLADEYGFKSDFTYVKAEVSETDEWVPMYDIEVEGVHSFTTSGVIVHNCLFQEQQMLLCTEVAGLTMGEANKVRKAISKKILKDLQVWKPAFIEGAAKKIGEKKAEAVWDDLEKSAAYAFNRAHSVGYSMISYWTAWFKANYPVEYMCALMNNLSGTDVKVKSMFSLMEAKRLGAPIRLPHVNASDIKNRVEKDGIRMGLDSIKYISGKVGNKIIDNGPYRDYAHLMEVAGTKGSGINSRAIDAMNKVGAAAFEDNPRTGNERSNFYEYLNIPAFDSSAIDPHVKKQFRPLNEYTEDESFVVCAMVYNIKTGPGWQLIEYVDEDGSAGSFASPSAVIEKGKMYAMLVSNNRIARYITTDELIGGKGGSFAKFLENEKLNLKEGEYRCISFNTRTVRSGPNKGQKMADAIFTDADKNLTGAIVFSSVVEKATIPCVTASKVRVQFAETKGGALYVKSLD